MALGPITVVAAVNSHSILQSNLLQSPFLAPGNEHQLLIREGFASAPLAYNDALRSATNDLVVFVHQDVYLPDRWLDDLEATIEWLDQRKLRWGVIGCFGCRPGADGGLGTVYSTGWGIQGKAIEQPENVETLDEIVLVVRRSAGLKFDERLPHYHMYGVDLCLTARNAGLESYVMPTFCVHNTNQLLALPDEYFACYRYVKRKWRQYLPVHSSCIKISRFNEQYLRKRMEAIVATLRGTGHVGMRRLADPLSVLPEIAAATSHDKG